MHARCRASTHRRPPSRRWKPAWQQEGVRNEASKACKPCKQVSRRAAPYLSSSCVCACCAPRWRKSRRPRTPNSSRRWQRRLRRSKAPWCLAPQPARECAGTAPRSARGCLPGCSPPAPRRPARAPTGRQRTPWCRWQRRRRVSSSSAGAAAYAGQLTRTACSMLSQRSMLRLPTRPALIMPRNATTATTLRGGRRSHCSSIAAGLY